MCVDTHTEHTLQPLRPAGSRLASPDKLKHSFREVPVFGTFVKALKMQSKALLAGAIAHFEFQDKYCTEEHCLSGWDGKTNQKAV